MCVLGTNAQVLGIPWESVFLVLSQDLPMEPRLTLNWQSIYLNFSNARIMGLHCLAFSGSFKRPESHFPPRKSFLQKRVFKILSSAQAGVFTPKTPRRNCLLGRGPCQARNGFVSLHRH